MPNRRGYYTEKMAELRARFGGQCERCGVRDDLEFAHIVPNAELRTFSQARIKGKRVGRGMPQRYHDIKKNPGNYRLLCHPCHRTDHELGQEVPF